MTHTSDSEPTGPDVQWSVRLTTNSGHGTITAEILDFDSNRTAGWELLVAIEQAFLDLLSNHDRIEAVEWDP